MEKISHCKLVARKDGVYTLLVFKDLESFEYIMCTLLPNWNPQNISINDEGFLKFQEVSAGEEYFDVDSQSNKRYKYSNIYFLNFIHKQDIKNTNIIL